MDNRNMNNADGLKLSVIVAIYNVEQYLDRCLTSLVDQTYTNLEIILVDDGSPDNCPRMCDDWAHRDARIKVVHKKNGGLGYARNSGLEVATGDYVAFVDSDDYLEKDMYRLLMQEAMATDADCVYCGFKQQLPSLEFVDVIDMGHDFVAGKDIDTLAGRFLMDFSHNHMHFSVWHGIYRRSLIDFKFVSEREYVSEDIVFTHMFMRRCKSFAYVPEALYHYMYNAKSLSRNYGEQTFERILATAGKLNEIYAGTRYAAAGNAYAFCQVYFLMRFPMMKARMPLRRKYEVFRKILRDGRYTSMLQSTNDFKFMKGLKYKIIKFVYSLHRRKMVRLNFLTILAISIKKG